MFSWKYFDNNFKKLHVWVFVLYYTQEKILRLCNKQESCFCDSTNTVSGKWKLLPSHFPFTMFAYNTIISHLCNMYMLCPHDLCTVLQWTISNLYIVWKLFLVTKKHRLVLWKWFGFRKYVIVYTWIKPELYIAVICNNSISWASKR